MDFFQTFHDLKRTTPRTGSVRLNSINSEYTHNTDRCKNCYLIANAVQNEDCMYGRDFYENSDCTDCDHILRCTLCYECVNCKECYDNSHLQDCNNCVNCDYGYDLKDCKNCMGCAGLRKKEFHIFNQPFAKEDFFAQKKKLSPPLIKERFDEIKRKTPRLYSTQLHTENCFGDDIYHSQNAYYGFDVVNCQDCTYITETKDCRDCVDIFILEYSELCYQISSCYKLHNCNFCFSCMSSSDLEFCEWVANSHHCFGCVGLNHKEYHILNKPYSREEYFKKVAGIQEELRKEKDYDGPFWRSTYPLQDTVGAWNRL